MTDLLCGSLIQAADFPATVTAYDATTIANITSTSFINGSPTVSVTFTAPTSGRVLIYLGGSAQNNGANADFVYMGLDLRETNSSGTIVETPAQQGLYTARWPTTAVVQSHRQRVSPKTGLTPGQVYYAGLQYRVDLGSGTADIGTRHLIVRPLP